VYMRISRERTRTNHTLPINIPAALRSIHAAKTAPGFR
jgi:hypothetical protein